MIQIHLNSITVLRCSSIHSTPYSPQLVLDSMKAIISSLINYNHFDQAIHLQDKLLLILSEPAIQSGWVDYEVELALTREIQQQREIIFPIRLDNKVLLSTSRWATTLQATRHIGDFTDWTDPTTYRHIFDRLLRDLKKAET